MLRIRTIELLIQDVFFINTLIKKVVIDEKEWKRKLKMKDSWEMPNGQNELNDNS